MLFNATTFNIHQEAAREFLRRKLGQQGSPGDPLKPHPFNTAWFKFDESSLGLPPFSIVKIGDMVGATTDALKLTTLGSPIFIAETPATADDQFAIVINGIPAGDARLGLGAVAGVVVCKVDVTDEDHGRAKPTPGETAYLTSAASGGVPILWKESGTGEVWAVIRIDEGSSGAVAGDVECIRVTSTTPTDDRYPGHIQDFDVETNAWSDRTDGECWIVDKNGLELELLRYEDCKSRGTLAADSLPVYTCYSFDDSAFEPTECILVTSLTTTAGRYPGAIQDYDVEAKTWSNRTDGECWITEKNGGFLELQRYEDCRRRGLLAADSLPVFTCLLDGIKVETGTTNDNITRQSTTGPKPTLHFFGKVKVTTVNPGDDGSLPDKIQLDHGFKGARVTTDVDGTITETFDTIGIFSQPGGIPTWSVPAGYAGYYRITVFFSLASRDQELALLGSSGAGGGSLYTDPVYGTITGSLGTVVFEVPDSSGLPGGACAVDVEIVAESANPNSLSVDISGPCSWPYSVVTTVEWLGPVLT